MNYDILVYVGGGALTGVLIGASLMYARMSADNRGLQIKLDMNEKESFRLEDTFRALSAEALNTNNQQFLLLAQQNLEKFQQQAEGQLLARKEEIVQTIKPVDEHLKKLQEYIVGLDKERANSEGALRQLIGSMATDQQKLRQETSLLVQALRNPNTRGQWGEMQLKRVLDFSNMIEDVDYSRQVAGEGIRPDLVIHLPDNKSILVDAKAPMDAYLNAYIDGISESDRQKYLKEHASHVRGRIKELSGKNYWQQFDSPEFTILFLPDESYLRIAIDYDPGLVEFGMENKVIPASPITLIALLRSINYGVRQEKMAQNAKLIAKAGSEIYNRLSKFSGHLSNLGRNLDKAVEAYNDSIGSLEKQVLPGARKLKELNSVPADTADISILPTEKNTRPIIAPELIENSAKKEALG